MLAEAGVLFVAGLWLLLRLDAPGAGLVRALAARWLATGRGGISAVHALLLIPVVGLSHAAARARRLVRLAGGRRARRALIDLTVAAAALVLIFRSRAWAATLAAAGLLVLGAYGWLIAVFWPACPGSRTASPTCTTARCPPRSGATPCEGSLLLALGLWLAPRVMRHHLAGTLNPSDLELAARARQLTRRVQTLTQTRHDAVDTAAAELRRIERDLHDGAQARLVALGMSLRAAERMFASNPEAALALVAEARETSSRALTDLRDLVRGIYPPVLADRGLADAVRALALDTPLRTELDVDLPGEVEMPVGAAVYFAVAEALANAVRALRRPHGPDPPPPRGRHAAGAGHRRRRGRRRPGAGTGPGRSGAQAGDV